MILDDFNILFDDYSENIEAIDTLDVNDVCEQSEYISYQAHNMLSPPISMPSSSTSKSSDFLNHQNDSDLRESNFLRRMNQSKSHKDLTLPNTIDNFIICKPVQVHQTDCKTMRSKVKMNLEKQPKIDQNFMRRATNRRAFKSHKKQFIENVIMESTNNIEYIEPCEVW